MGSGFGRAHWGVITRLIYTAAAPAMFLLTPSLDTTPRRLARTSPGRSSRRNMMRKRIRSNRRKRRNMMRMRKKKKMENK
jgi:hypothetical protein